MPRSHPESTPSKRAAAAKTPRAGRSRSADRDANLADADADRLLGLIAKFERLRVAVIGDFLADEFIYGRVARVSREAPVLILEYDRTQLVPGGAGNAANNVAALGARTRALGLIGADETGARLKAELHANVDSGRVLVDKDLCTTTKTRILAGGIHSAKQQVVRIDRGTQQKPGAATRARFEQLVLAGVARCDAVLVSDYGAGLVSPKLVAEARRRAGVRKDGTPVPVLIDSRYELQRYKGLTACTPNQDEVEALLGVRIDENMTVLERAGRDLLARMRHDIVLVTRGSRGMALFEKGQPTRHIGIYGSDEIADVTGAGDTVIATMTLALAAGASAYDAARLANCAGGLVVMKRGTATVSANELREAVRLDFAK
jgi:rfaE bifunctional protein kinase chain/domain